MVGCVIARDDAIIGEGWHKAAGDVHAEVMALKAAGVSAVGATAYVTLEPCAHQGKTPPCVDALIGSGVGSVVIGMADPNPYVSGEGADRLRDAGVSVRFAEDPKPFEILNEAWCKWVTHPRRMPWIETKLAMSLDGRIALERGQRWRITGEGGAVITRVLRASVDAVIVGGSTYAADRPSLTVRDEKGRAAKRQPMRVILTGMEPLRVPDPVMGNDPGRWTILVRADAALEDLETLRSSGWKVIVYTGGLEGAFAALGENDIVSVLIEPGARLFTSLVDADLIDELVLVQAGGIGGAEGLAPYESVMPYRERMDRLMVPVDCGITGEEAYTVWRPRVGS